MEGLSDHALEPTAPTAQVVTPPSPTARVKHALEDPSFVDTVLEPMPPILAAGDAPLSTRRGSPTHSSATSPNPDTSAGGSSSIKRPRSAHGHVIVIGGAPEDDAGLSSQDRASGSGRRSPVAMVATAVVPPPHPPASPPLPPSPPLSIPPSSGGGSGLDHAASAASIPPSILVRPEGRHIGSTQGSGVGTTSTSGGGATDTAMPTTLLAVPPSAPRTPSGGRSEPGSESTGGLNLTTRDGAEPSSAAAEMSSAAATASAGSAAAEPVGPWNTTPVATIPRSSMPTVSSPVVVVRLDDDLADGDAGEPGDGHAWAAATAASAAAARGVDVEVSAGVDRTGVISNAPAQQPFDDGLADDVGQLSRDGSDASSEGARSDLPDYTGARTPSDAGSSTFGTPGSSASVPRSTRASLVEETGGVAASVAGLPEGGRRGAVALRLEVSTLEARLVLLQASIREAESKGQGISDSNARAEREIKLRKSVDSRRLELETQIAGLRGELKDVETARLIADRAAAENAEIANQWKERSDAFEAAYEKQRADQSAAIEEAVAVALVAAGHPRTRTASATAAAAEASLDSVPFAALEAQAAEHQAALAEARQAASAAAAQAESELEVLSALRSELVALREGAAQQAAAAARAAEEAAAAEHARALAAEQQQQQRAAAASAVMPSLHAAVVDVARVASTYAACCAETASAAFAALEAAVEQRRAATGDAVPPEHAATLASASALAGSARDVTAVCSVLQAAAGALPALAPGEAMGPVHIAALEGFLGSAAQLSASPSHSTLQALLRSSVDALAGAARDASEAASSGEGVASITEAKAAFDRHLAAAATAHAAAVADLRKEHEATLEARTALVAEWENYANHWEERGREAERLTKEWETCFDELQAQHEQVCADAAASVTAIDAAHQATAAAVAERDKLQGEVGTLRQYLLRSGATPPSATASSPGPSAAAGGGGVGSAAAPSPHHSQPPRGPSHAHSADPSKGQPASGIPPTGSGADGAPAVRVLQVVKRPSLAPAAAAAAAAPQAGTHYQPQIPVPGAASPPVVTSAVATLALATRGVASTGGSSDGAASSSSWTTGRVQSHAGAPPAAAHDRDGAAAPPVQYSHQLYGQPTAPIAASSSAGSGIFPPQQVVVQARPTVATAHASASGHYSAAAVAAAVASSPVTARTASVPSGQLIRQRSEPAGMGASAASGLHAAYPASMWSSGAMPAPTAGYAVNPAAAAAAAAAAYGVTGRARVGSPGSPSSGISVAASGVPHGIHASAAGSLLPRAPSGRGGGSVETQRWTVKVGAPTDSESSPS